MWKTAAAVISMLMLIRPAIERAITTSTSSNRKIFLRASSVAPDDAPLREGRVEVDDVGHAGRAEDPDGEQHALGAVEAGHEAGRARYRTRRARPANTWKPKAITITPTNAAITTSSLRKPRLWRARIRKEAAPVRSAAGNSGSPVIRLIPIAAPTNSAMSVAMAISSACTQSRNVTGRENLLAAHLGQVHPRRDPELGAHRLDQHRHQVCHENDPEEEIAELRTTGHVRGEVAGVDVRDRRDEGRPEERGEAAKATALAAEGALGGAKNGGLSGKRVLGADDERAGDGRAENALRVFWRRGLADAHASTLPREFSYG